MTGPYMGPTPAAELAQQGQQVQAGMAASQAAYREQHARNVANSYTNGPDTAAMQQARSNANRSAVAAAAIFFAGWYVLPPGRARSLYMGAWLFTVLAIVTTDLGGWGKVPSEGAIWENEGWKLFIGVPTIWTYLFGALAVYCWVQLIRMVIAIRRYNRMVADGTIVEEAPAPAPLPETFVEDMNVPEPPFTAQVVVTPSQEPPATSKLWLPTSPTRRVRRGGETLSGVPIKDRRSVDPRTL